ncbi:hypothetical protein BGZ95_001719, partial [Linnemannia exigua]
MFIRFVFFIPHKSTKADDLIEAIRANFASNIGINVCFSPAYNPQSNGLVERFMTTLRNMIVSYLDLPETETSSTIKSTD